MTDASAQARALAGYRPANKVRFVTATGPFDGDGASIDVLRRVLQGRGAEVVHLGPDRPVDDVVTAALHEDVQGVVVGVRQGGPVAYLQAVGHRLRERGGADIRVFGRGDGVVGHAGIDDLQRHGVTRLYSTQDVERMGLAAIAGEMLMRCDVDPAAAAPASPAALQGHTEAAWRALAQAITAIECGKALPSLLRALAAAAGAARTPVIGITGTGGAGKSSLTDELVRRLRLDQGDALRIAVICIDPSRRKGGGALLGDRIRMNAIGDWACLPAEPYQGQTTPSGGGEVRAAASLGARLPVGPPRGQTAPSGGGEVRAAATSLGARVFMRSLATRDFGSEISQALPAVLQACKAAGFDVIVVETSGIGQGDAAIVPLVDVPVYVMTPEFGAPSQLEKIDMLDFAEFVVINKFDRKGAEDALRDVAKQVQRNRNAWMAPPGTMPVFGTMAGRFDDDGVTALYQALLPRLAALGMPVRPGCLPEATATRHSSRRFAVVPGARVRYLADIADALRNYRRRAVEQSELARQLQQLRATASMLQTDRPERHRAVEAVNDLASARQARLAPHARKLLATWPDIRRVDADDVHDVRIGDREVPHPLALTPPSGGGLRRVALPNVGCDGEVLKWLLLDNVPGTFPYTAGTSACEHGIFGEARENPSRLTSGTGDAARANRRFVSSSSGMPVTNLVTVFDIVTRRGLDPDPAPEIDVEVGGGGVSIATLDDMKLLYAGFDLTNPSICVDMTADGPAPALLAMLLNAAVEQKLERFVADNGRQSTVDEVQKVRDRTFSLVRGTLRSDVLEAEQSGGPGIFGTDFALKVMGDIVEWFDRHDVRHFKPVSFSGARMARAGADPVSQLAFTLANAFTFVEACLARGMHVDHVAPRMRFVFGSGMDAEHAVLGRVARRIWAVAMRDRYGADERSQKLVHAVRIHPPATPLDGVRTTLQALMSAHDHCHGVLIEVDEDGDDGDDDGSTTTSDARRLLRAEAVVRVIEREWGLAKYADPDQGAFVVDALTERVEAAVLALFEQIAERGGVFGAMETGYQRSRIEDDRLRRERALAAGASPAAIDAAAVGSRPAAGATLPRQLRAGSTDEEKRAQRARLDDFRQRHAAEAPAMLQRLQRTVIEGGNVFAVLMDAVRCCSLGQITRAMSEAGAQRRRSA